MALAAEPGRQGGRTRTVARPRREAVEKLLPVALFVVAAIVSALVLPSALRPPNQQPNQTAALSPDAPPSDDPEAIVATLNRAGSGVGDEASGEGDGPPGDGPGAAAGVGGGTPPSPPTTLVPRACPKGVGVPPRQVESIYAPGCAAPFTGNNGGSTYRGVTRDTIRLMVRSTGNRGSNGDNCDTNGELDAMDPLTFNPAERTFYVFQQYFNLNFQFYGRQLKFFCVQPEGSSIASEQASVALAADTYGVYGAVFSLSVQCAEFARKKMVAICEGLTDQQYKAASPYKWASFETQTANDDLIAEYACKKLTRKKAVYAGEPRLQALDRKFGIITYDNRDFGQGTPALAEKIRRCGAEVSVVYTTPVGDTTEGAAQLASAATQFQQDGVTTVIPIMDVITVAALTNSAQSQGYIPEWLVNDSGAISQNQLGGLMNQAEWAHAFGFTFLDAQRPDPTTECYRAYRSIDASNTPSYVICNYLWRAMMLFAGSIQEAGPNLNPETQLQGFRKLGRYWDVPVWALGGSYGPDRYGYLGDVTEIFWDPAASDPGGRSVGAYRYVDNGKRYCPGHLSAAFKPFDPTNAPSLVPDYAQPAVGPPKATCLDAHPPGR